MSFCNTGSRPRRLKAAKKEGKVLKKRLDCHRTSFLQKRFNVAERGVPERLDELKRLISAKRVIEADRLFQETADYIALLKAQVVILQRLVDFYGKSNK